MTTKGLEALSDESVVRLSASFGLWAMVQKATLASNFLMGPIPEDVIGAVVKALVFGLPHRLEQDESGW